MYQSPPAKNRRSAALMQTAGVSRLSLDNVPYSSATLPNPPADEVVGEGRRRRNLRGDSITDLAFLDGQVIVTGLTAGDGPSNARTLAFPFVAADRGASLEIYHGAHGREEDNAVVRTFVALNIGGEPSLLAGFTCTPLVRFPLGSLVEGDTVRGTTVAELGNRNRPLDMIVYQQGGKDYLLMANSARGVMKVSTDDIERDNGITERVGGGGTAGQNVRNDYGVGRCRPTRPSRRRACRHRRPRRRRNSQPADDRTTISGWQ